MVLVGDVVLPDRVEVRRVAQDLGVFPLRLAHQVRVAVDEQVGLVARAAKELRRQVSVLGYVAEEEDSRIASCRHGCGSLGGCWPGRRKKTTLRSMDWNIASALAPIS